MRLSEGRRERVTIEGGDPAEAAGDSSPRVRRAAPRRSRRRVLGPPDAGPRGARRGAAGVPVQVGGGLRTPNGDRGSARTRARPASSSGQRPHAGHDFAGCRCAGASASGSSSPSTRRTARSSPRAGRPRSDAHRRRARAPMRRGRSARACSSRARAATARWPARTWRCSKRCSRPAFRCSPPEGSPSLDDLRAAADLGCEGAVVGSAIWAGRFSLAEALAYCA